MPARPRGLAPCGSPLRDRAVASMAAPDTLLGFLSWNTVFRPETEVSAASLLNPPGPHTRPRPRRALHGTHTMPGVTLSTQGRRSGPGHHGSDATASPKTSSRQPAPPQAGDELREARQPLASLRGARSWSADHEHLYTSSPARTIRSVGPSSKKGHGSVVDRGLPLTTHTLGNTLRARSVSAPLAVLARSSTPKTEVLVLADPCHSPGDSLMSASEHGAPCGEVGTRAPCSAE